MTTDCHFSRSRQMRLTANVLRGLLGPTSGSFLTTFPRQQETRSGSASGSERAILRVPIGASNLECPSFRQIRQWRGVAIACLGARAMADVHRTLFRLITIKKEHELVP